MLDAVKGSSRLVGDLSRMNFKHALEKRRCVFSKYRRHSVFLVIKEADAFHGLICVLMRAIIFVKTLQIYGQKIVQYRESTARIQKLLARNKCVCYYEYMKEKRAKERK